ncbi:MAG: Hsp20/alpha crystallin family protein [Candidatus Paceibacterota bacterium]|jgi:HSP20 family protein
MAFLEKFKKPQEEQKPQDQERKEESQTEKQEEKMPEIKNESKNNWGAAEGQLAIDMYETEQDLVLQTAIAGIEAESLDISLEKDLLIVRGERKNPAKDAKKNYFVEECYFGLFSREIILPREIDPIHTKAAMESGLLTIRMPKIERDKKRKIVIEE